MAWYKVTDQRWLSMQRAYSDYIKFVKTDWRRTKPYLYTTEHGKLFRSRFSIEDLLIRENIKPSINSLLKRWH